MIKTGTDTNFDELVKDKIVIVDFWAEWCGPCRLISPTMENLAEKYPQIDVIKVDVDENYGLSQRFGIRNIPYVLLLKNGEIINKKVGAAPIHHYEELLKPVLDEQS